MHPWAIINIESVRLAMQNTGNMLKIKLVSTGSDVNRAAIWSLHEKRTRETKMPIASASQKRIFAYR